MRIKYTVPTTSFFIDLSTLDYIPNHLAVNRNLLSTFGTVELVTIIRVGYLLTVGIFHTCRVWEVWSIWVISVY